MRGREGSEERVEGREEGRVARGGCPRRGGEVETRNEWTNLMD